MPFGPFSLTAYLKLRRPSVRGVYFAEPELLRGRVLKAASTVVPSRTLVSSKTKIWPVSVASWIGPIVLEKAAVHAFTAALSIMEENRSTEEKSVPKRTKTRNVDERKTKLTTA